MVKGKRSKRRKEFKTQDETLDAADLHEVVENEFLQSVLTYKKILQENKKIKVFDKLGKPQQFKPVDKISNKNIDKEWIALHDYLYQNSIYFYLRNQNVCSRELYRFVTEELFELEIENIDTPGLMSCFIYDEFYPDLKYDNQKIAVDECISCFFEKKDFFDFHFRDRIKFNRVNDVTKTEFYEIIKLFRATYDTVNDLQVVVKNSIIKGFCCKVTGSYKATLLMAGNEKVKAGKWMVEFIFDKPAEWWYICNVQIKGLIFYLPWHRTVD